MPVPRLLPWLVVCYVAALAVFAWLGHPVPVWGRENDQYFVTAERLLVGQLPEDPFRPAFYPLSTAALGFVLGDCFLSAKLISCVGAGLTALMGFRIAQVTFGDRAGWWTAGAVAANGWLLTSHVQATTDALWNGLTLTTLALLLEIRIAERPRRIPLLAALFALAFFTRYQTIVLLVPIGFVLLACRGVGVRERWGSAGRFAAWAGLFLFPHFLLTWLSFGDPFRNDNWRNVLMKYTEIDYARIGELDASSLREALFGDPWRTVEIWLADVGGFFASTAPRLLGGSDGDAVGVALAVAIGVGVVVALVRGNPRFRVLFVFSLAYVAVVTATFIPTVAICSVLAPVAYAALFGLSKGRLGLFVGVVVLGVLVARAGTQVSRFVASHPAKEIAATTALLQSVPVPVRYLSTYPYMSRYAGPSGHVTQAPRRAGPDWIQWFFERALRQSARHEAQYLVYGRALEGPPGAFDLLEQAAVPPQFERLGGTDPDVALFRINRPAWIGATRRTAKAGTVRLELDLTLLIETSDVAGVGFFVTSPSGETLTVGLSWASERTYAAAFSVALAPGTWTLVPVVTRRDGVVRVGRTIPWTVP